MMVFFQTGLGKLLIWQKLSQTLECAFKLSEILYRKIRFLETLFFTFANLNQVVFILAWLFSG